MHMILCQGPIDFIKKIFVDDDTAWEGSLAGGRISIDEPDLFGGESSEGGIVGDVDIEFGGDEQGKNDYLQAKLNSTSSTSSSNGTSLTGSLLVSTSTDEEELADIPAFRGVVGAVLRQVYLGMNPYLKTWSFLLQRIYTSSHGAEQWYRRKAGIPENPSLYDAFSIDWKLYSSSLSSNNSYYVDTSASSSTSQTITVETGDGETHDVVLNVTGLVELKTYTGSEVVAGTIVKGGTPGADVNYNIYKLTISEPAATYYFNNGTSETTLTEISETITVSVADGATVTLSYNVVDGKMIDEYQYLSIEAVVEDAEDMNPAHIIRECLTDREWGMGYSSSDVDDDSFTSCADTLFSEGMKISILWNKESSIEDFVNEIKRHINAELYVDRTTGKFVLKLIRDDYNEDDLITLNESNITKITNYNRVDQSEATNSVVVNFWDRETLDTASVTADDLALVQLYGIINSTTVEYPGFTNATLASRVAARDLRSLSAPLLSCTIEANREASSLNLGDVFKFEWPDYHDGYVVMRVAEISFGDGKANKVKITATEDVFSLPVTALVGTEASGFTAVGGSPVAASHRIAFEAPYYELVSYFGQTTTDSNLTSNPDLGYLKVAAARPNNGINAEVLTDSGSGYADATALDFCPAIMLAADISKTQTEITFSSYSDIDLVSVGELFQIGDEICVVNSIDETTGEASVGRGCLDTVPQEHAQGDIGYFWQTYSADDTTEYVSSEEINVKILTKSTGGTLSIDDAPVDSVTLNSRAIRPYPPGNFKVNGEYFPGYIDSTTISLIWSHRDRLQQTSGDYYDFTEASIGPENGTTYVVEVDTLDSNGDVLTANWISEDVGLVDSYSINLAENTPDSDVNSLAIRLYSKRASYLSMQCQSLQLINPVSVALIADEYTGLPIMDIDGNYIGGVTV